MNLCRLRRMADKRTLILLTGFACNNNCVICSLKCVTQTHTNRSTKDILKDIIAGKREGYERIEFTGGEPAIRKDIFELIKFAKQEGFKEIGIGSNGKIFYYRDICRALVTNGLNKVCISLHGHTTRLHDAIVRAPGSFEKTTIGIKNMLGCRSVMVDVATVVTAQNYKHMAQIGKLLFDSLGVRSWCILDLIPDGNAEPLYRSLAVKLTDLSHELPNIFKTFPKGSHVTFFDFPLCLFSADIKLSKDISVFSARERYQAGDLIGYGSSRIEKRNETYMDRYKVRVSACRKCCHKNNCSGIWRKYNSLFGETEVSKLAKLNT